MSEGSICSVSARLGGVFRCLSSLLLCWSLRFLSFCLLCAKDGFRAGFGGCHGSDYRCAVGLDFRRFFPHVVLECRHLRVMIEPLLFEEHLFMMLVPMMLVGAAPIFNLYEPAPR